jgi:hypothetical protein
MRFKVNSRTSNIVIGIGLIPFIGLVALVFDWGEAGRASLAVAAGAAAFAVLMAIGLVARRFSREIEVTDDAVREYSHRGGMIEIRWAEPHRFDHEVVVVRRRGIPVSGLNRVTIEAEGRRIAFSANAQRGMLGVAAKLPGSHELRAADEAIARMRELSKAATS